MHRPEPIRKPEEVFLDRGFFFLPPELALTKLAHKGFSDDPPPPPASFPRTFFAGWRYAATFFRPGGLPAETSLGGSAGEEAERSFPRNYLD